MKFSINLDYEANYVNNPGVFTVPDKCTIPYETGNCANYRVKWYFDTKDQR